MTGPRLQFCVSRWSWWAPAEADTVAEVPELPPLLRRRASRAARAALRVAFDCVGAQGKTQAIFVSRHGEVHRSVELLDQLCAGEPLSQNAFALSVHNAAAALYSLCRGDPSPLCAMAAGPDGLPQAMVEAVAQLDAGAPEVLVVAYDDKLPAVFQPYAPDAEPPHALGLLLRKEGAPAYSLELTCAAEPETSGLHAAQLAGFLKDAGARLDVISGPRHWTWRAHA